MGIRGEGAQQYAYQPQRIEVETAKAEYNTSKRQRHFEKK